LNLPNLRGHLSKLRLDCTTVFLVYDQSNRHCSALQGENPNPG